MIQVLIGIALKSLLMTGGALGLLHLARGRSAAERSWIAHVGLAALVLVALAPLLLPSWNVEVPALATQASAPSTIDPSFSADPATTGQGAATANALDAAALPASPARVPSITGGAAATMLYALPAAILLFMTFLAIARLIALRARAEVLVDGHWLSALARAQKRMGFKHGTALLTSDDLRSPISWGMVRPVILLNSRAVEAAGEAEAILAHELAHVARMDWAKLLLARVATALFWFNPLVWILAREAHQLREEAADDAVLSADIAGTDYAQLLVGVARHECPGLLLVAHGVAPSKSSLKRRITRVLDGDSPRGPVARSFTLGVLVGALAIAAPLAALTLKSASAAPLASSPAAQSSNSLNLPAAASADDLPADLATIIGRGVATTVSTAAAAVSAPPLSPGATVAQTVAPNGASLTRKADGTVIARSPSGATVTHRPDGMTISRAPNGATATIYPPDAQGRRRVIAVAANGARAESWADEHDARTDALIELKTNGVTNDYVSAMRAAASALRSEDGDNFAGMRSVGVTPDYARAMVAAGFRNISSEELIEARAVGLDPAYVRSLASAGVRLNFDDYIAMRSVGVPAQYPRELQKAGVVVRDGEKLVEMWTVGVRPDDARRLPPRPPAPVDPDADSDGE